MRKTPCAVIVDGIPRNADVVRRLNLRPAFLVHTSPTQGFQVWRESRATRKWVPKDMVGPNVSLWLTVPEGAGTIATQGASFRTPSEHERINTELATLCKVKKKFFLITNNSFYQLFAGYIARISAIKKNQKKDLNIK